MENAIDVTSLQNGGQRAVDCRSKGDLQTKPTFHLNGVVNKQNVRIWAMELPHCIA